MRTFTFGTLNVLSRNSVHEIFADMELARARSDVWVMQELQSRSALKALSRLSRDPDVGLSPRGGDNAVAYRRDVFRPLPGAGSRFMSAGIPRISPTRKLVWQPLQHRPTGRKILVAGLHVVAGYANDRKPKQRLRDAAARKHMTRLSQFTASRLVADEYDAILLGGDFNCPLERRGEWWYPGRLLRGMYVFDNKKGSIDRLIYTVNSRVESVRRTSLPAHSDHRLHLHTLRLT